MSDISTRKDYNQRRAELLGTSLGSARNRLTKLIIWQFLVNGNLNRCWQCGGEILSIDDLSIEHIEPWQSAENPKQAYFDLENISFSHLTCNVAGASRPYRKECGTENFYRKGCECNSCVENKSKAWKSYWDNLGPERQKERRKENYRKYGC